MAPSCVLYRGDWRDSGYSVWSRSGHAVGYRAFRPYTLYLLDSPIEMRLHNFEDVTVSLLSHFHILSLHLEFV